ncbi:hypothetical protein [Sphingomonas aerolata]|uniref:hypothetical protein n=1 Tax=Sphingomonas aerolata TaxID=185951 RepID=UPI002FE105A3
MTMIMTKPRSARWLAAMLLLGVTCTASAERPRGQERGPANVDAMQAREADDIALLLHLRPDQRGAVVAFLSAWGPPPPPRDGGEGPNMRPGPSMPGGEDFARHLERFEAQATAHAAHDRSRLIAARSFYDSLDTPQRAGFEALMRLRHAPPGPGGPGGPLAAGPPPG